MVAPAVQGGQRSRRGGDSAFCGLSVVGWGGHREPQHYIAPLSLGFISFTPTYELQRLGNRTFR